MCGHKTVEVGAACLLSMVQGEGALTEAALTGAGAFLFSLAVSYTPLGKKIDRLAEPFAGPLHSASSPATLSPDL